jgi:hypothetical protein
MICAFPNVEGRVWRLFGSYCNPSPGQLILQEAQKGQQEVRSTCFHEVSGSLAMLSSQNSRGPSEIIDFRKGPNPIENILRFSLPAYIVKFHSKLELRVCV